MVKKVRIDPGGVRPNVPPGAGKTWATAPRPSEEKRRAEGATGEGERACNGGFRSSKAAAIKSNSSRPANVGDRRDAALNRPLHLRHNRLWGTANLNTAEVKPVGNACRNREQAA